jgi:transposase
MKRHELTDEQWNGVDRLIPRSVAKTGRPPSDRRTMLNSVLWILHTGAPWRDLPERFGPWQTAYHHFSAWRRDGVLDRIVETLQLKLDKNGLIDFDLWCVDGSNVRAARAAAGADKKASTATPKNPKTTLWAAAEADLEQSSIWLLTARAFHLPSR